METSIRQLIQIDEEKCDGCGLCLPSCPEGALQVVAGKARLVRESYCDGLGACLGGCPQGALQVVRVAAAAYDEAGVLAHLRQSAPQALERHQAHLAAHGLDLHGPDEATAVEACACPSAEVRSREGEDQVPGEARQKSRLRQWPVQLRLLPPHAPFFQDADLTLVADCVPVACPNFHADYLADGAIAMGCPKLDDARAYVEKVSQILRSSSVRSLKVVYMEVPCCLGLVRIAQQALALSGKDIPFSSEVMPIYG